MNKNGTYVGFLHKKYYEWFPHLPIWYALIYVIWYALIYLSCLTFQVRSTGYGRAPTASGRPSRMATLDSLKRDAEEASNAPGSASRPSFTDSSGSSFTGSNAQRPFTPGGPSEYKL